MNNRFYTALAGVMYSVFAVAFICLLGSDFLFHSTHIVKIVTTFFVFLCGFLGSACLRQTIESVQKRGEIAFTTTIVMFAVYIIVILDFTLVDGEFGRNISNFFALSLEDRSEYIKANTNLIPFATIRLFINGYNGGNLSLLAICENIFGNLIAFMPYAYFLPKLFPKAKKWAVFCLVVIGSVLVIEVLQILFLTGSADIDDLILNTLGALGAFLFFKSKGFYK